MLRVSGYRLRVWSLGASCAEFGIKVKGQDLEFRV